eukprot:TRINITY_DN1043_c0_g4_i1.p1 TRINITY_DN1043_c0_g4~~TRINITY_DN1043_c0_g4_i1.p1  ORF type:complete len:1873 (+),score=514.75 TRINITY_DN1043_c0_g4_i1:72-5621(+)
MATPPGILETCGPEPLSSPGERPEIAEASEEVRRATDPSARRPRRPQHPTTVKKSFDKMFSAAHTTVHILERLPTKELGPLLKIWRREESEIYHPLYDDKGIQAEPVLLPPLEAERHWDKVANDAWAHQERIPSPQRDGEDGRGEEDTESAQVDQDEMERRYREARALQSVPQRLAKMLDRIRNRTKQIEVLKFVVCRTEDYLNVVLRREEIGITKLRNKIDKLRKKLVALGIHDTGDDDENTDPANKVMFVNEREYLRLVRENKEMRDSIHFYRQEALATAEMRKRMTERIAQVNYKLREEAEHRALAVRQLADLTKRFTRAASHNLNASASAKSLDSESHWKAFAAELGTWMRDSAGQLVSKHSNIQDGPSADLDQTTSSSRPALEASATKGSLPPYEPPESEYPESPREEHDGEVNMVEVRNALCVSADGLDGVVEAEEKCAAEAALVRNAAETFIGRSTQAMGHLLSVLQGGEAPPLEDYIADLQRGGPEPEKAEEGSEGQPVEESPAMSPRAAASPDREQTARDPQLRFHAAMWLCDPIDAPPELSAEDLRSQSADMLQRVSDFAAPELQDWARHFIALRHWIISVHIPSSREAVRRAAEAGFIMPGWSGRDGGGRRSRGSVGFGGRLGLAGGPLRRRAKSLPHLRPRNSLTGEPGDLDFGRSGDQDGEEQTMATESPSRQGSRVGDVNLLLRRDIDGDDQTVGTREETDTQQGGGDDGESASGDPDKPRKTGGRKKRGDTTFVGPGGRKKSVRGGPTSPGRARKRVSVSPERIKARQEQQARLFGNTRREGDHVPVRQVAGRSAPSRPAPAAALNWQNEHGSDAQRARLMAQLRVTAGPAAHMGAELRVVVRAVLARLMAEYQDSTGGDGSDPRNSSIRDSMVSMVAGSPHQRASKMRRAASKVTEVNRRATGVVKGKLGSSAEEEEGGEAAAEGEHGAGSDRAESPPSTRKVQPEGGERAGSPPEARSDTCTALDPNLLQAAGSGQFASHASEGRQCAEPDPAEEIHTPRVQFSVAPAAIQDPSSAVSSPEAGVIVPSAMAGGGAQRKAAAEKASQTLLTHIAEVVIQARKKRGSFLGRLGWLQFREAALHRTLARVKRKGTHSDDDGFADVREIVRTSLMHRYQRKIAEAQRERWVAAFELGATLRAAALELVGIIAEFSTSSAKQCRKEDTLRWKAATRVLATASESIGMIGSHAALLECLEADTARSLEDQLGLVRAHQKLAKREVQLRNMMRGDGDTYQDISMRQESQQVPAADPEEPEGGKTAGAVTGACAAARLASRYRARTTAAPRGGKQTASVATQTAPHVQRPAGSWWDTGAATQRSPSDPDVNAQICAAGTLPLPSSGPKWLSAAPGKLWSRACAVSGSSTGAPNSVPPEGWCLVAACDDCCVELLRALVHRTQIPRLVACLSQLGRAALPPRCSMSEEDFPIRPPEPPALPGWGPATIMSAPRDGVGVSAEPASPRRSPRRPAVPLPSCHPKEYAFEEAAAPYTPVIPPQQHAPAPPPADDAAERNRAVLAAQAQAQAALNKAMVVPLSLDGEEPPTHTRTPLEFPSAIKRLTDRTELYCDRCKILVAEQRAAAAAAARFCWLPDTDLFHSFGGLDEPVNCPVKGCLSHELWMRSLQLAQYDLDGRRVPLDEQNLTKCPAPPQRPAPRTRSRKHIKSPRHGGKGEATDTPATVPAGPPQPPPPPPVAAEPVPLLPALSASDPGRGMRANVVPSSDATVAGLSRGTHRGPTAVKRPVAARVGPRPSTQGQLSELRQQRKSTLAAQTAVAFVSAATVVPADAQPAAPTVQLPPALFNATRSDTVTPGLGAWPQSPPVDELPLPPSERDRESAR